MTQAHEGADPLLAFAEVALGELAIGIDTRFVMRALARPIALARLPRSHGAIDGVFSDAGQAVPVIDLRKWMGEDGAATPPQVLVLGAHGRRIALAVDAVRGLVRARASQVQRIHHGDDEEGFFHSVAPGADGHLLSLLDPLRLMERVQVWTGAAAQAGPAAAAIDGGPAAAGESQALVRLGAATLAVPARLVIQVLPQPPAQRLFAGASQLVGMIQWRGRHVPLLDPDAVLGIAPGPGPAPLAMVLAQGDSVVALPVDAVAAVRTLPADRVDDARQAGLGNPLLGGVALLEDGARVLLLDGEALLAAHAAPGLSQQGAVGGANAAGRSTGNGAAHIVVDTGRRWAVPMSALEEIMTAPAGLEPLATQEPGVAGSFTWRARTLPVLDLREPDLDAGPAAQRLIVVGHGGRHAGLWVRDVVELLPAHAFDTAAFQLAGGARVRMLTVGLGAARTSYPVLDLAALPFFARPAA